MVLLLAPLQGCLGSGISARGVARLTGGASVEDPVHSTFASFARIEDSTSVAAFVECSSAISLRPVSVS